MRCAFTLIGLLVCLAIVANHEREGQNVLYADGHVSYEPTPLCGTDGDNLYTARDATKPTLLASPAGPGDSALMPAED